MHINRVMIVSTYAPPSLGGPQNIYNLLYKTNPKSYCIITSFYNIDNISAKIGTWLPGEYIFYDKINNDQYKGTNVKNNISKSKNKEIVTKLKYIIKRSKFFKTIISIYIIIGQIFAIVYTGKKNMKKRGIDSILAISDYGPAMISAFILHLITKKKYHIFLFDLYKGNNFPFPGNQLASLLEKYMFRMADKIIVTNLGTKDFYKKIYKNNIIEKIFVINNSTFKQKNTKKDIEMKTEYSIMFTGRIYWPQIEPLKNLIRAIKEMVDLNIKLKIYTPSPKDYLEKLGIKEEGIATATAGPEAATCGAIEPIAS